MGTIAATTYSNGVAEDLSGVLLAPLVEQVREGIGVAAVLARQSDPQIALLIREPANPAFVHAFTSVFEVSAVFMGLAALSAILLIPLRMQTHQMGRVPDGVAATIDGPAGEVDVWQEIVLWTRGQKSSDMGIGGGD